MFLRGTKNYQLVFLGAFDFINLSLILLIFFCQCDGYALDLANGPRLEGIALLNIPSIYGGTNLWGDNPSQKKRRKAQKAAKKDKDREFSTSSMSSAELSIAVQGRCPQSQTKLCSPTIANFFHGVFYFLQWCLELSIAQQGMWASFTNKFIFIISINSHVLPQGQYPKSHKFYT